SRRRHTRSKRDWSSDVFSSDLSFHEIDSSVPIEKQAKMLDIILYLYERSQSLISFGFPVSFLAQSDIFNKIINIKYNVPNDKLEMLDQYYAEIDAFMIKQCKRMDKERYNGN